MCANPFDILVQALHQHEEELLVVLGNVALEGFHLGSFVDVHTLGPSPQAALQHSQRLLQVTTVHSTGPDHCSHSVLHFRWPNLVLSVDLHQHLRH